MILPTPFFNLGIEDEEEEATSQDLKGCSRKIPPQPEGQEDGNQEEKQKWQNDFVKTLDTMCKQ